MAGNARSRVISPVFSGLLMLALSGCAQPAQSAQSMQTAAPTLPTSVAVDKSAAAATATRPATVALATPTPLPATKPPTLRVEPQVEALTPTPSPSPDPDPSPTLRAEPQAEALRTEPQVETRAPALRQLTQGGCCTQPFWSPDARQVLFIDKPAADAPVGIWGVDVTQPAARPQLAIPRIASYTPDLAFVVEVSRTTTTIERLTAPLTGTVAASWTAPAGGRSVSISPGRTRVAWQVGDDRLITQPERQVNQVWVANLDGSAARAVVTLPRGSLSGWISDDVLLLSGRESTQAREQVLWAYSLTTGQRIELARGERLRVGSLSRNGTWLAYMITMDQDQTRNGLWLVRTDGTVQHKLAPDLFGTFQWRDDHRLLIIPFRPDATSHEFMEFDADAQTARRLTDPAITPFKITNGDWAVSPDGRQVVFVASQDHNLWLLTLPD
jgi:Tol biopolymer transport system component